MNHTFKPGDVVRIIDTPDNRLAFKNSTRGSAFDQALKFDAVHVVRDVDATGAFIGKGTYLMAHRLTGDRRAAPAPAVLPSKQLAWDKYAEERLRQGLSSGTNREQGFMEGYGLGYQRGKLDAMATAPASYVQALARANDPATSKQAAAVTQAGKLKDLVLVTLRDKGPMTAHEVAEATGHPLNAISPRFAQLKRQGLIHVSGGKQVGRAHRSVYTYGNELAVKIMGQAVPVKQDAFAAAAA